ncbi:hypothetical protein ACHAXH_006779 [Discostella pseudostelligera]
MLQDRSLLFVFAFILVSSKAVQFVDGFAVRRPMITVTASPQTMPSSSSLAAKGGGKNKSSKRSAQTTKGFGLPPPTLEDVLATFKTRIPEDADNQPCPCGTGQTYGRCCGPFHRGDRKCATMTDVLRSRYSAFAWRNIEYVMDTTHESCRDYREDRVAWANDLHRKGMFDGFEFEKLSAGDEEMDQENDNEGYIEFKVTFRARHDGKHSVAGQETVISERSRFLRNPTDGTWSYASGDVRSDVAGLEGATLNVG